MLHGIRLLDDEYKDINISIDNETIPLSVKKIDKLQTYINLNKSIDIALFENIEIDALLYHEGYEKKYYNTIDDVPDEDLENEFCYVILKNNDIIDENGIIVEQNHIDTRRRAYTKGSVYISITDNNNTYYENNMKIENGIIKLSIPNTLKIGTYTLTIEFSGNQFFTKSTYQSIFQVSKRPIECIIKNKEYYANAGETIQIPIQIIDKLNKKTINNYTIQYEFNNTINNIISDSSGNLIINELIPNPDKTHCNIKCNNIINDDDIIDEDGNIQSSVISEELDTVVSEPNYQVIYPLIIFLYDNETYTLPETTIFITVKKVETEVIIKNFPLSEDNRSFNIGGYIKANTQMPYAKYGLVDIILPNNNYQINNICIDDSGYFEKQILVSDIENVLSNETYQNIYDTIINNIYTKITTEKEEININVEDFIDITAHVEQSNGSPVNVGMITFSLYENDIEKYIHVSELDNSGSAKFNFLTTKSGDYIVRIKYEDNVLGYKESEIEVKVRVDE